MSCFKALSGKDWISSARRNCGHDYAQGPFLLLHGGNEISDRNQL
jgi:hypothetical protein